MDSIVSIVSGASGGAWTSCAGVGRHAIGPPIGGPETRLHAGAASAVLPVTHIVICTWVPRCADCATRRFSNVYRPSLRLVSLTHAAGAIRTTHPPAPITHTPTGVSINWSAAPGACMEALLAHTPEKPMQPGTAGVRPAMTHIPDRSEPAVQDAEGAEPQETVGIPAGQPRQQQQQQPLAVVRGVRVGSGEHEVTLAADGRKAGAAKRGAAWGSDKTRSRLCRAALLRRVCELLDLAAGGADGAEAEVHAGTEVAQAGPAVTQAAPAAESAPAGDTTGPDHHRQLLQQDMKEQRKLGWWWNCSYGALKRQLLGAGYSRAWAALKGGPAGSGLFTLWLPKPEGEADFTAAPHTPMGSLAPR